MIRRLVRTFQVFNSVTLFVTVAVAMAVLLATCAGVVQQRDGARALTKPFWTSVTQAVGASWQTQRRAATAQGVSTLGEKRNETFAGADSKGVSFLPPELSGLGCIPFSIAVGDVNGDGKPDLVVADWFQGCSGVSGPGEVDVLLGNGDGTFQAPVSYASGGIQSLGVAIGDVDGDGKPDLVVVSSCASGGGTCYGQVGVLIGNGDGTFQPVVGYPTGDSAPVSVTIADVNRDGHPDLIVANSCHTLPGGGCTTPGSAGVLLGNGDGTFQPSVIYPADPNSYIVPLAVADLNGDGHLDVVMGGGQGVANEAIVSVLLGNGDGTFQPEISYDAGGTGPSFLAVADVSGDGHPDVVVAMSESSGVLSVLLGKGDGTLQAPVVYNAGGDSTTSVAIADVNGDGHPDLIAASSYNTTGSPGPGELGVLLGNGDGTFQAAQAFPSGGSGQTSVAVADVNGDGKPDLLLANFCSAICTGTPHGTVGVLLNNSGTPQSSTTTTLKSSSNSSGFNQSVTFKATVSSRSGTPAGTLIFYDGATQLGSATLAGGKASISVSSLLPGSHWILAIYEGSSSFAPSASPGFDQVVKVAKTALALTSSKNPAGVNHWFTYTATVTSQYGGTATGTVTFADGGYTFAIVPVSGNHASHYTKYGSPGTYSITAKYSGDGNNASSVSRTLPEEIGDTTETAVSTSGSPSLAGQPVTFTAKVTSIYGPIPNGELVTFYHGLVEIGTGNTNGGVATLTTSSLAAKSYTIHANYVGDGTFLASSGEVTQVVNQNATTASLVSGLSHSGYGQVVALTATVTSAGPTPTGNVKFTQGSTQPGSGNLGGGLMKFVKSNLAVGSHSIPAQYVGSGASGASASPVLNEVVSP
jgi:Bacterial Ig-like domain (group 3)/FG-GAP-like repeat